MAGTVQLKGPAGIAFAVGILGLLSLEWVAPEMVTGWIGQTETSYRLVKSGHVARHSINLSGPGARGSVDDYSTGVFPAIAGNDIVLKLSIRPAQGSVVVFAASYDWALFPHIFWRTEAAATVDDTLRVPVPESGFYGLIVSYHGFTGDMVLDWSVQ